ncbi:DUF6404 family protein [Pseudoxanthomonas wuyuanensis]|uniref:DUF6404 family protein n=1 Tax=Pseudoxanthomonas wuyuanensis TaxID=1073196 RepID=UPI003CCD6A67
MCYPPRVEVALEILASSGLSSRHYAPPLHKLMWRHGIAVAPPHFAGFFWNFLFTAPLTVAASAGASWLCRWIRYGDVVTSILETAVVSGFCASFFTALYFSYAAEKHNLPRWSSISTETET